MNSMQCYLSVISLFCKKKSFITVKYTSKTNIPICYNIICL